MLNPACFRSCAPNRGAIALILPMLHRLIHSYPARLAFVIVGGSIALLIRKTRILLNQDKNSQTRKA